MPPKKRTTKATAAKKEQETKLKVLLADFDEKCKRSAFFSFFEGITLSSLLQAKYADWKSNGPL